MKGLFMPGITAEMFRNGCLEGIEALMAEGEIYDIEYDPKQQWTPVSEGLPEEETDMLVTRTFLGCEDSSHGCHIPPKTYVEVAQYFNGEWIALSDGYKVARNRHTEPVAWMPLPEPYKEENKK